MAYPAGVKNDGHTNAGLIHAGKQFLRCCYPGFRLRIKQGKARIRLDIFVTPFPQPGGKYMRMKIYNHLRHYTQTTKNTKIPWFFVIVRHLPITVIASPSLPVIASTSGLLSLRAKCGNLINPTRLLRLTSSASQRQKEVPLRAPHVFCHSEPLTLCHSEPFTFCHSEPKAKNLTPVQGKLRVAISLAPRDCFG